MSSKKKIDIICDQLRSRICSGQLCGGDILVEEALGREFSLSRTPIRQVLHRLALEHFVETRSGVGTIVVPEDRTDFAGDVEVCSDLLQVSLKRADRPLSEDDLIVLTGLHTLATRADISSEDIWRYFYQATRLTASHLGHDLVSETFVLLSSRIFRRLIIGFKSRQEILRDFMSKEHAAMMNAAYGRTLLEARLDLLSEVGKVSLPSRPLRTAS